MTTPRTHLHALATLATLAALVTAPAAHAAVPPLTADNTAGVFATVLPSGDEDDWLDIPWQTDLWQARQRAAAEGKPLFLWEMDGHPLGCT